MSTLQWSVAVVATLLPPALHVVATIRSVYLRMHLWMWLATLATGAALFVPLTFLLGLVQSWAEIDPLTGGGDQVMQLAYAFLIRAPLEMTVVLVAVLPFWRLRRLRMRAGLSRTIEIKEGVAFAVSGAFGFATARNLTFFYRAGDEWLDVGRASLWLAAFVLLCAGWGYLMGRYATKGMRSRRFRSAWLGATIFSAVCDQLCFRQGTGALLAVLPLVASMLMVALVIWRDAVTREGVSSGGALSSLVTAAPAPSLNAIREAFRRQDRPLTLRWISFGALVTTGMITTGAVAAVLLGHELGIDFSVVDRHDSGTQAMAPLVLLGCGVLAAFPSSGYLLARASGSRSVLEPAMAGAIAMVLVMVFMGMLAPVSVVFAIAFSPVAFALSCIGAWVGTGS